MKNLESPLSIAIAGGSCSGKSTLESNLQGHFGDRMASISFDDFFVGLLAIPGGVVENWDDPALYRFDEYEEVMSELKAGHTVGFVPHSYEAKAEGITRRIIEPRPLLAAAGFLALHAPKVNRFFDTTFFIDLPEDEIVSRRLTRSNSREPGPWNDEDYIRRTLIPSHRRYILPQRDVADHVIDGLQSPEAIANQVIQIIGKV